MCHDPPVLDPATSASRRRWIAVAAGIAVALVVGEGLARWRYAHPPLPPEQFAPAPPGMFQADPSCGFRLAPGFSHPTDRFTTNAMGFRDVLRAPGPPPAGTVRVAVVGDSFTAGVGVADDEQFTRLLERGLAQLGGPPVEVWNLGVPHFGSQQSMLQLLDRWDVVQPNVVVFALFDGNDAWDDVQGPSFHTVRSERITRRGWGPWPGDPYNDLRSELNRPLLAHHIPGDGVLHRRSALYRVALRGAHAAQHGRVGRWPWGMEPFDYEAFGGVAWLYLAPPPPPIAGGWEILDGVVAQFDAEVRRRGAGFAVLAVPSKILIEREDLRLAFEEGWEDGHREGGGARDGSRDFDVEAPTRRVEELTDGLGIPRIDVAAALVRAGGAERVYYRDDSHWNGAGHRVAALALGEGMARLDWIPAVDGLAARLEEAVPVGSAPETYGQGFRRGDAGPGPRAGSSTRALDDVADTARPIPFGQALVDLTPEEITLLYPTLVSFAAPGPALAALLPDEIAGLRREDVLVGVQEDAASAWIGAMGTYLGPGGKVTVLIQDTAWEPTQVNRYAALWGESRETLADGRPVARVAPDERGGTFLQAAADPANPRIVFAVHALEGVDVAVLSAVLEALPSSAASRLQVGYSGPFARSGLLPDGAALARLRAPAVLAAALPPAPSGWSVLAEGHGFRREAKQSVSAVATRVLGSPAGVIEATIQDLGPPGAPVVVEAGAGRSSAKEIRGAMGKGGGARCSPDLGVCKWATLVDDRLLLSLSGPRAFGAAALQELGAAFGAVE